MLPVLAEEAIEVAAVKEDRQVEPKWLALAWRAEPGSAAVGGEGIIVGMGQAILNPPEMLHLARNVLAQATVAPFPFGDLTRIAAKFAFYPTFGDRSRQAQGFPYPHMGL